MSLIAFGINSNEIHLYIKYTSEFWVAPDAQWTLWPNSANAIWAVASWATTTKCAIGDYVVLLIMRYNDYVNHCNIIPSMHFAVYREVRKYMFIPSFKRRFNRKWTMLKLNAH